MSTWEPEETPPLEEDPMPSPTFDTTWRGYHPGQVADYLRGVAGRVWVLQERTRELESELEQARRQGGSGPPATAPEDPYEMISDRVVEVVRAFDQDVERIRAEAESEAHRIVDEAKAEAEREAGNAQELRQQAAAEVEGMLVDARAEADRIRVDAQANAEAVRGEAERALDEARARADEVLSELDGRRESLVAELRTLHDRMLDSARDLEPVMETERADDEIVIP